MEACLSIIHGRIQSILRSYHTHLDLQDCPLGIVRPAKISRVDVLPPTHVTRRMLHRSCVSKVKVAAASVIRAESLLAPAAQDKGPTDNPVQIITAHPSSITKGIPVANTRRVSNNINNHPSRCQSRWKSSSRLSQSSLLGRRASFTRVWGTLSLMVRAWRRCVDIGASDAELQPTISKPTMYLLNTSVSPVVWMYWNLKGRSSSLFCRYAAWVQSLASSPNGLAYVSSPGVGGR